MQEYLKIQKDFDDYVLENKNIKWESPDRRFRNTVSALMTEIGEFANEIQWFKVWKEKNEPKTAVMHPYLPDKTENLVLGEAADVVAFFLSIANQRGWEEQLIVHDNLIEEARIEWDDASFDLCYAHIMHSLSGLVITEDYKISGGDWSGHEADFASAWIEFIFMLQVGLSISYVEWTEAYEQKMQVNRQRQRNGY
jgi:dimeric dUTPase (all-alpha-NTP-PPase superfamily)